MNSPMPRHENRAMHDKLNELLNLSRQNAADIAAIRAEVGAVGVVPNHASMRATMNQANPHVVNIQRIATQISMAANDPNAVKSLADQLQAETKALGDANLTQAPATATQPVQTTGPVNAPTVPGAVVPIDKKD